MDRKAGVGSRDGPGNQPRLRTKILYFYLLGILHTNCNRRQHVPNMKTVLNEECSAGATWEIISDIFPRTFRILHGVAYTIAVTEVLNGGGGAMINHPPRIPSDTQLNWNSLHHTKRDPTNT